MKRNFKVEVLNLGYVMIDLTSYLKSKYLMPYEESPSRVSHPLITLMASLIS